MPPGCDQEAREESESFAISFDVIKLPEQVEVLRQKIDSLLTKRRLKPGFSEFLILTFKPKDCGNGVTAYCLARDKKDGQEPVIIEPWEAKIQTQHFSGIRVILRKSSPTFKFARIPELKRLFADYGLEPDRHSPEGTITYMVGAQTDAAIAQPIQDDVDETRERLGL